jgi:hypothetical protein
LTQKQPTQLPTHFAFAHSAAPVYIAVMASWAKPEVGSPHDGTALALVPPPEFKIQTVGRSLPRVETPEGWIKKVDRAREGKVWVGYFHVWETTSDGRSVRRKKEKTLGPATKAKHEALKELPVDEPTGF